MTATGQITVAFGDHSEHTMRFCKRGNEIGGGQYHGHYLNFDINAVQAAMARVAKQKNTNATVAKILAELAEHRTGFGDYVMDNDTKAKLLTLVTEL